MTSPAIGSVGASRRLLAACRLSSHRHLRHADPPLCRSPRSIRRRRVLVLTESVRKVGCFSGSREVINSCRETKIEADDGTSASRAGALFNEFLLDIHVPADHVNRFVPCRLRQELALLYASTGRPSVDPEVMIRMLIVGYCFGIRSKRWLSDEVHFNLACRWFCRLLLNGRVRDHYTFSKNRHGRYYYSASCVVFRD